MFGQDLSHDISDADAGRNRLRRPLVVTGNHPDFNAYRLQLRYRLGRAFLDGVGHSDQAGQRRVHRQEHDCFPLLFQRFHCTNAGFNFDPVFAHQAAGTDQNRLACKIRLDSLAGNRQKTGWLSQRQPLLLTVFHNRLRQWMLRFFFHTGCDTQDFVSGQLCQRHDIGDFRLAFGNGAGLIQHDRVQPIGIFQVFGAFDQNTVFCSLAGPDHDRGRCRQAERAGTGNHHHGGKVHQSPREITRIKNEIPGSKGNDRQAHHRRHKIAGHDIGEPLDRRLGPLRRFDDADDLGQRRVFADFGRPKLERAQFVDCGADDRVADLLVDRNAFASQHGFVQCGGPFEDNAIHRHFFTRSHHDDVI